MQNNNIFSPVRFAHLTKRYYVLNYKRIIIEMLGGIGILSILGALGAKHAENGHQMILVWYYIIIFLGGYITTSNIFSELHKPEKSIHFLTLPASSFEKLVSGWLNSTIIFIVMTFIAYQIAFFLSTLLALWWFKIDLQWINILDAGFFKACILYIITQSVFLFGAVYFKGKNFFKTIFALFLLFLVYSIYHSLVGSVALNEITTLFFEGNSVDLGEAISAPGLEDYAENTLVPILKFIFYYIMPIFFLTLSYIKLKEREA